MNAKAALEANKQVATAARMHCVRLYIGFSLRARLKTLTKRRVRTRGLQETSEMATHCRPGALTGLVFKQALSYAPRLDKQTSGHWLGVLVRKWNPGFSAGERRETRRDLCASMADLNSMERDGLLVFQFSSAVRSRRGCHGKFPRGETEA